MSLQDQRFAGIAGRTVGADHGAGFRKIMLDRAKAAQILQGVEIDLPVVDLVATLAQEIADHVLARPFRAAGGRYSDKIHGGRKLRVEIGVDGIEDFSPGIESVHCVSFLLSLSESRPRQYSPPRDCTPPGDTDARQSQHSVSHHRRTDRGGQRARLQSLSDQEGTGRPADQCRPERTEDTKQMRQDSPATMKTLPSKPTALLVGLVLF